jgi:catechol 2,3-dioxygenase-like lactoylglutathione lyase family enzyme
LPKQKNMPSLHTISITVKDLAKSLDFYRTLGLAIPEGQENEHHVEYTSENGYSIGFIPETTMLYTNPNWKAPTGDNRIGLQFACASPAAVDETYAKLIAAGHTSFKAPWDAFWGQRFAQVIDPDGNNVGLFAEL